MASIAEANQIQHEQNAQMANENTETQQILETTRFELQVT